MGLNLLNWAAQRTAAGLAADQRVEFGFDKVEDARTGPDANAKVGVQHVLKHVLTHVPSKLPSLQTSLLNSSTGLRAYGSGPLLRKRGLYTMCNWNLGEKGSAQFSHCAMISASCFLQSLCKPSAWVPRSWFFQLLSRQWFFGKNTGKNFFPLLSRQWLE